MVALHADTPRIAMQVSRGVVVASIQVDLDEPVLARFQQDLLGLVHETGARGVILDVSGLELLDSEEFAALRRIIAMVALLGAESVLVGLRPGIVAALVELGADVDGLHAAINLDAAFARFEAETETTAAEPEDTAPAEPAEPGDAAPAESEPSAEPDR